MADITSGGAIAPPYSYPSMDNYINPNSSFFSSSSNSSSSGLGGPLALLGNLLGWVHEDISSGKQRDWSEQMMDKQNQFSLDMWNRTNEYNSPKAQLQRMIDAGLNPLYFGLDGSSANSFESAQPLTYDRSSVSGLLNPIQSAIDTNLKTRLQDAQVNNLEAQTAKIKADTEGSILSNDFARDTYAARVEGEKLANNLKKKQIELIDSEKEKISKELVKIEAETKSEASRKLLFDAEAGYARAKAWQIATLLPLQVELTKAQTEHEKAMAVLTNVQALYQKDMLTSGYIQSMVAEIQARTEGQLTQNDIKELELDIKNGDSGRLARWFNDNDWRKALMPAIGFLSTDLWSVLNQISVSTGGILGPILGFAAGKGVAKKAVSSSTKYTSLYGPDGKSMTTVSY